MASRNNQRQYIIIDDFSPGIWANTAGTTSIAAPRGAAQIANTYGCTNGPNNELIPGPALVGGLSETNFEAYAFDNSHFLDSYHILGMRAMGPLYDRRNATNALPYYPDQVFVMHQYATDSTGGGGSPSWTLKMSTKAYKLFTYDNAFNPGSPAYVVSTQTDTGLQTGVFTNPSIDFGSGSLDLTRQNKASPTTAGAPTLVGAYYPSPFSNGTGKTFCYPDYNTPTTDSSNSLGFSTVGNAGISNVFAHQDRVVGLAALKTGLSQTAFGTVGYADPSDYMEYLNVNDISASTGTLLVDSENPHGYGTWKSMNASTLFLVKKTIGGVMVSGPLEQPTITRMPGIPGTGLYSNIGCISPNGTFIYGSAQGVYEWSGGDTAALISTQLSANTNSPFWSSYTFGNLPQDGLKGSFASVGRFVFAPNSYFWTGQGWWRLNNVTASTGTFPLFNPVAYNWYDVSAAGYLIASPNTWNPTNSSGIISYYDINKYSTAGYSWQSQPFSESINRELDIREINLTVTGSGTVTITIAGINNTSVTETVAFTNFTTPRTININTDAEVWDPTIKIVVSNGGTVNVHRVSLGYVEQETAR